MVDGRSPLHNWRQDQDCQFYTNGLCNSQIRVSGTISTVCVCVCAHGTIIMYLYFIQLSSSF